MTVNTRTRRGARYIERHGFRRVFLDGVHIPGVFYTDTRRRVVRAYLDESRQPFLNGELLTFELRGRRITFEPVAERIEP